MRDLGRLDLANRDENGPGRLWALATLAGRQHGVISHRQLIGLGFSAAAIGRRLGAGGLHPLHRGVYAVGHTAMTARGRWMAAVLACGPDAALSHTDSAALFHLRPIGGTSIHVSAPRSREPRAGIVLHRVRRLHPDDRTTCEGIPTTSVARTLLDLAEVLRPDQLERAFEQAERLQVLDLRALERVCERSRGRRGLRPLRALFAREQMAGARETRSELERRFLDLCRSANLPLPAVNVTACGFEVDMLWARQRLVVELDGYAFHRSRRAFEQDRVRDAALQVAGYRVLRVTSRWLAEEPGEVVRAVRSLLGLM